MYRKKILFISDNFVPETNAAASRVFERAIYWKKWGVKCQIITSFPNRYKGKKHPGFSKSLYKKETIEGLSVTRVKTFVSASPSIILRSFHQLSFMISAAIAGLFQKNISIVIVTTPQFFCSLSGLFLSRIKKVPFILEIADIWSDSLKGTVLSQGFFFRIIESFEAFIFKKSDALVVLTKGFKKEIVKKGINSEKIFVSRNGVNPLPKNHTIESDKLRNKLNINQKKVIGYLGAHGLAQDLSNVIKAAKILEEENPNILFLFIGDGDEKIYLQKLGKNLTNIIFLEAIKKNEISNYLSLFNIGLAHLKNDEIFKNTIPSKIFEMMSGGLPILLVSPRGEASKIIIKNKVGKWVPSGNPDLLALEIINMLKSEDDLKELSTNSLIKSNLFRRDNQAKQMLDIVDKLLS